MSTGKHQGIPPDHYTEAGEPIWESSSTLIQPDNLKPSNSSELKSDPIMRILDEHTKALTRYTEPDGTVILDADTVLFDVFGAKTDLQAYVAEAVRLGKVEALEELKHRWHEDRRTFDYSPATYDFIADQEIKKLKGQEG